MWLGVCQGCMRDDFDPDALTDDGYCEECDSEPTEGETMWALRVVGGTWHVCKGDDALCDSRYRLRDHRLTESQASRNPYTSLCMQCRNLSSDERTP